MKILLLLHQSIHLIIEFVFLSTAQCEVVMRHLKIERIHNGEKQICLSTTPVAQCSSPYACVARTPAYQRQAFHCLPAHTEETLRLVSESKIRPIPELEMRSEDTYQYAAVAEDCYAKV